MRSYGASSAFANASNNNGMNGSLNGEESDIGDCNSDGEKQDDGSAFNSEAKSKERDDHNAQSVTKLSLKGKN